MRERLTLTREVRWTRPDELASNLRVIYELGCVEYSESNYTRAA